MSMFPGRVWPDPEVLNGKGLIVALCNKNDYIVC